MVDAPLTDAERAAIHDAIPQAQRVVLNAERGAGLNFKLGLAAFFTDGSKMAMRMWCNDAADRARFLKTAAIKLRDWHDAQAAP